MDPKVLGKRAQEGYAYTSFGGGDWIGNVKIVRL